eukprot:jgi/Undpi1/2994/HiC_scaffold_14.g06371.m1
MFVHTLLTTTGSGIVGPVLMRDPPLFLENDKLVTCIMLFFLFAVVFDPYVVNFARRPFLWKAMAMLQTTSRMNKICLIVDYSLTKLPASQYYPIALFGPILIGLARGIGGGLVPCDKGMSIIRKDLPWKVQLCFTVAAFYHIVSNDTYLIGGLVRGFLRLESISKEDTRVIAVGFGSAVTLIQTYYWASFNPFTPTHKLCYALTGMPSKAICAAVPRSTPTNGDETKEAEEKKKKEAEEKAARDLQTRKRLQTFLDALKPIGVASLAVLALYSREPPSMLSPGDSLVVGGDGLAVCSFLPAALSALSNGCEPLRATVTESGSLVVFRGGKTKGAASAAGAGEGGVVWSSPAPKKASFAAEDVRLELSEDGILSVMGGDKALWSSTLTPLGKRLPAFRVEARLDAAKGALEVYKGGQLQWSSAGAA